MFTNYIFFSPKCFYFPATINSKFAIHSMTRQFFLQTVNIGFLGLRQNYFPHLNCFSNGFVVKLMDSFSIASQIQFSKAYCIYISSYFKISALSQDCLSQANPIYYPHALNSQPFYLHYYVFGSSLQWSFSFFSLYFFQHMSLKNEK